VTISRTSRTRHITVSLITAAIAAAAIAAGLGGAAEANAAPKKPTPVAPAQTKPGQIVFVAHNGVVYRWDTSQPPPWAVAIPSGTGGWTNVGNDY
jgi:hypothetical protein